jgi:ankyrin repeat protein
MVVDKRIATWALGMGVALAGISITVGDLSRHQRRMRTQLLVDAIESGATGVLTPDQIKNADAALATRVEMLIRKGAALNGRAPTKYWSDGGQLEITPLHAASGRHLPLTVRTLITGGADVNARDTRGQTPLMRAVRIDNPQIVRLLIQAGADARIRDSRGRTARTYAEAYASSEPVLAALKEEEMRGLADR